MSGRPVPSRRTVLYSAAAVSVTGLGAAACGPGGESGVAAAPTAPVDLGAEKEVAPGSVKLYRDHNVVVGRDEDGALKAYSTVCTHAGCAIDRLEEDRLVCPCHGSEFDPRTGEVLHAPATVPLEELRVKASGGRLVAGPGA
ncbi:ubiquinol-cytochrome c reductase iron-sulfur subunit [Streptomyces sp. CRN 30]|uniref:QcrA and Rieske domain-containing protein n=1 Tax=Streptomyces sp. CRN 30 TaxID=3075613 RepID=UPI002A83243C|nr:Rieske 2Fe-2S domain-containing protein [Streptomyces sp. CRN 30]